jgi:hypothetical protein
MMRGLPGLTKGENKIYSRLRTILLKSKKYSREGGDENMSEADEVKSMSVEAMYRTLNEGIIIEDSRVVARHGNTFVRILENMYREKIFDDKLSRREKALKKLAELKNAVEDLEDEDKDEND